MNFISAKFICDQPTAEIIIAALGSIGFDTFEEKDNGVDAYITEANFDRQLLDETLEMYGQILPYTIAIIPKENWNELWEKNYDPIEVDDRCIVRATFHQIEKRYPIEILVEPKMSFGTGHHATTYQMIKAQLDIDHLGKSVVDLGTGTGILAILAKKLGAAHVEATDIDDWCIENSRENYQLNGIDDINTHLADAHNFEPTRAFDIVLANINKNVLLNEMGRYALFTKNGGLLLLSGFYDGDVQDILHEARKYGFELLARNTRSEWAQLVLQKNDL